jgi:hypothetical protein
VKHVVHFIVFDLDEEWVWEGLWRLELYLARLARDG